MATRREGSGSGEDARDTTTEDKITLTIIPAETPEVPGRLMIDGLNPSSTIGEIRTAVQGLIPSRPALQRLRLICAGSLLADDARTLEQIVGAAALRERKAVTFHLALRPAPEALNHSAAAPQATNPGAPNPGASGGAGTWSQRMFNIPPAGVPNATFNGIPLRPASTPGAAPQHPDPRPQMGNPGMMPPQAHPNPEARMRMQEQMLQQHLHETQLALQRIAVARQQQLGMPDFQRHLNEQHRLRHLQPTQTATPNATSPQSATPAASQQPAAGSASGVQHNVPQRPQQANIPPFLQQPPLQPNVVHGFVTRTVHMNGIPVPPSAVPPQFLPGGMNIPSQLASYSREHESVYLLSSPQGHEAIIFSPPIIRPLNQAFVATVPASAPIAATTTAPYMAPANGQAAPRDQANPLQPQAQQGAAVDLAALLNPLARPLWLLARLVFFTTIFTFRRNWTQSLVIYCCAALIFLHQTGLLQPIGPLIDRVLTPIQGHIEGLVRDIEEEQRRVPAAAADGGSGATPDPQQAADRLLRRRQDQGLLRRAERSVALFVASFVPGVGEAQVAAREAADRRRRQEAEERSAREQREREEREQQQQQGETQNPEGEAAAATATEQVQQSVEPRSTGPADSGVSSAAAPVANADAGEMRHRSKQATVEDVNSEGEDA